MFAADPGFPYVAVRVAHVLGGDDDFTGRLEHYADRIRAGGTDRRAPGEPPGDLYPRRGDRRLPVLDGGEDFTGPVNAASHGPLTTEELCEAITAHLPDGRTLLRAVEVGEVSPFSFSRSYGMDNSRATRLGFSFGDARAWLPRRRGRDPRKGRLTCATAHLAACG